MARAPRRVIVQQHLPALRDPRKGDDAAHVSAGDDPRRTHAPVIVELRDETDFAPTRQRDGGAHRGAGGLPNAGGRTRNEERGSRWLGNRRDPKARWSTCHERISSTSSTLSTLSTSGLERLLLRRREQHVVENQTIARRIRMQ